MVLSKSFAFLTVKTPSTVTVATYHRLVENLCSFEQYEIKIPLSEGQVSLVFKFSFTSKNIGRSFSFSLEQYNLFCSIL